MMDCRLIVSVLVVIQKTTKLSITQPQRLIVPFFVIWNFIWDVWFGLFGFNASATARVISRRWNDDDDEISFLVEETGEPGGNHIRPIYENHIYHFSADVENSAVNARRILRFYAALGKQSLFKHSRDFGKNSPLFGIWNPSFLKS